jgi:hypothetical protein
MHKQRTASGISGGILLISLGILIYTGWWWPGIMLAIGLASGAELAFRGQYLPALVSFGILATIPLLVAAEIPWAVVAPLVLIALGTVLLVKVMFPRSAYTGRK